MTFRQWTEWLETRNPAPLIAPGLDRTLQALRVSGLDQCARPSHTIHIAGTNGKGTTARALEHLLSAAGQNVGLYTSPHLVSTCERIRTGQRPITEDVFVSLCEKHKKTIESCDLTHFEALTLIALDYFANEERVDWMIFEIGLGGLWDATNAIPHNTSVVTSIGFDHMHILGNTLESIAENKFGIIQSQNRVFYRQYPASIARLLELKLQETHSTGHLTETLPYIVVPDIVPQYQLQLGEPSISLGLPGRRSIENVSMAIHVFLALGFSPQHISSLSTLQWPARMTELRVPGSPCPVYLSGDHNQQGIESLMEILEHSTYETLHVVLGLSKNRKHEPFVQTLGQLPNVRWTFTKPQFQGVTPDTQQFSPFYETPQETLQHVFKEVDSEKDLIVVTGSLYLCGDFLKAYPQTP